MKLIWQDGYPDYTRKGTPEMSTNRYGLGLVEVVFQSTMLPLSDNDLNRLHTNLNQIKRHSSSAT